MPEAEVFWPHSQVSEALERRDAEIAELRRQGGVIVNDFERALNLIVGYQRSLGVLGAADPCWYEARELLHKYGMEGSAPRGGKVFVDQTDITADPYTAATAEEVVVVEEEGGQLCLVEGTG